MSAISGLLRLAKTVLIPSVNSACMVVRSSAAITFSAVCTAGEKCPPTNTRPDREGGPAFAGAFTSVSVGSGGFDLLA